MKTMEENSLYLISSVNAITYVFKKHIVGYIAYKCSGPWYP